MTIQELAGGFDTNRGLEKDTDDYTYDDDSDIEDFEDAGGDLMEDNDEVVIDASADKVSYVIFYSIPPILSFRIQRTSDTTIKDTERVAIQEVDTGMTYNVAVPDIAFAT